MPVLHIELRPIASLRPNRRNPRTHTKRQIEQIARSISSFGFTTPLLIDDTDMILAGHGRLAAAKLLGQESVPTIRLSSLSEVQKRAFVIADNKLALNAGWSEELLALELQYLSELEVEFDLGAIGFETAEIDLLLSGLAGVDDDAADQVPPIDETAPPVNRTGDLWQCGRHRVVCGDATQPEAFTRLMAGAQAQLVFTDPPYNVPIHGHGCWHGQVQHPEFAMAGGEMSSAQYIAFLETVLGNLATHSIDGSIHFICMDWRHIRELLCAAEAPYGAPKNLCVWNKTNAGLGSLYRSKHELVFVFKSGTAPHINNVKLGRHGRNRTNVWDYHSVNMLKPDRLEELEMHPSIKPIEMVGDAVMDCSNRGGIVLDAFLGSGTTLLAAEQTGRRGYGIELDPRYVDLALRRLAGVTGLEPVHAETGMTFAELQAVRIGEATHAAQNGADQSTECAQPPNQISTGQARSEHEPEIA